MFNLHSLGVKGQEGQGGADNTTHMTAMFEYEFLSWCPGTTATYVEFHTIGTIPGAFETHRPNYLYQKLTRANDFGTQSKYKENTKKCVF
jgi:hypothetical protein